MIVFTFDMAPPIGIGTLVRVKSSRRLGRVVEQHQRFPQPCGRYYLVAHGACSTYYWEHEIAMAVAESFQHILTKMGSPLQAYKAEWRMKPEESFEQFRGQDWDTLEHRLVGGAGALAAAYMNAAKVEDLLRKIGTRVAGSSLPISDALNHGSALALGAAQMVNSSLLTHLRVTPWYEHATLLMLRTALEMAGASALFAIGPADQQRAWVAGHHVSPTNITLPALGGLLRDARADAPDPVSVYGWLSEHVHFTKVCIDDGAPAHEEAYATLAYVAWSAAVVAEAHVGIGGLAVWPMEWPERLPWETEPSANAP